MQKRVLLPAEDLPEQLCEGGAKARSLIQTLDGDGNIVAEKFDITWNPGRLVLVSVADRGSIGKPGKDFLFSPACDVYGFVFSDPTTSGLITTGARWQRPGSPMPYLKAKL